MGGLGRDNWAWNVFFGLWAIGLIIWDQKWGLIVGLALGALGSHYVNP